MKKIAKQTMLAVFLVVCTGLGCEELPETNNTLNNKIQVEEPTIDSMSYRMAKLSLTIDNLQNNKVDQVSLCYNGTGAPTLQDQTIVLQKDTFQSYSIAGLQPDSTYYLKAYVQMGEVPVLSEEVSFSTKPLQKPGVETNEIEDISATSATSGGNVVEKNGSDITARGVCWSTSSNPTLSDNYTQDSAGLGNFASKLDSLTAGKIYYVRAYATNETGTSYGEEKSFTTQDGIIQLTTKVVTNITATSATSGGTISDNGGATVTARGICWGTSPNPTTSDNYTTDGSDTGSFTSNLENLELNATYYLRAYATNEAGTGYGEEKSFTTEDGVIEITTESITEITATSATSGGTILDNGGFAVTERGVCWSTSSTPTTSDNHTTEGSGTGSFTSELTGLSEGTTYYVRAYVTNEVGTGYGEEKSFTVPQFVNGIEVVEVSGGTFEMGCTSKQSDCDDDETPVHTVTVYGFEMSKYEITNQQYADFMNEIGANSDGSYDGTEYLDMDDSDCQISYNNGSFQAEGGKDNYPVIEVTWYGANAFCRHYDGRLPTEAEWEFAARGGNSGTATEYAGSNNIDEVAWYWENSENPDNDLYKGKGTHEVGTKAPNELGIYDMSGNVWEWCNDWYRSDYYSNSPQENPLGPAPTSSHVLRGGSWRGNAGGSRVANRDRYFPMDLVDYDFGFRLCRTN